MENSKLSLRLDDWQKQVLATTGNICLCSGRQVGKSTVIAIDAGEYALNHKNKEIMIISAVERQALLLFEKVLAYIHQKDKKMIKKGKERPTKHEIRLINGSIIRCLPTGLSGHGIRGFTINRLYADEAAFIPEDVWQAVTPMLATTGGDIVLLSTPFGREGYFYRCFNDDNFKSFQISTEEVANKRDPTMRERMLDFIKLEKQRMSKRQYAQEYGGEFIDELQQFFSDELIKKTLTLSRRKSGGFNLSSPNRSLFLGVDCAGLGGDESTFEILDATHSDRIEHIENITRQRTLTTQITREILMLNSKYDLQKIFLDDGGLGFGVFSQLLEEESTRRKTIPINNASRSLDRDGTRKKKLLKEDLYNNLLRLMERNEIKLLDDPEVYESLKSVQYEYVDGKFRIFGNYTHIVEGLIRAAWCVKYKNLSIWIK